MPDWAKTSNEPEKLSSDGGETPLNAGFNEEEQHMLEELPSEIQIEQNEEDPIEASEYQEIEDLIDLGRKGPPPQEFESEDELEELMKEANAVKEHEALGMSKEDAFMKREKLRNTLLPGQETD